MVQSDSQQSKSSLYRYFDREEWAKLRADTPLTLSETDLFALSGINENISLDEVLQIYLPLTRLLNLHVAAAQNLNLATSAFLGHSFEKSSYIIGLAGSVAVGKSTTARVLQALLAHSANRPRVDLVTTDGFLYPNDLLKSKGLLERKGFPESYDLPAFVRFLSEVKSGYPKAAAPVYSHLHYDVLPDQFIEVARPDILIVEGLNILQSGSVRSNINTRIFVSDFFDFSIYVDADESVIKEWYVERFLALLASKFQDSDSYFHRYANLSAAEAVQLASKIWDTINSVNLRENILPTRQRAKLILRKARDHSIQSVELRNV